MALWLFKEEPSHYSYDDLERDDTTVWDGVTNNLALQHLRRVRRGDGVLYYHTGNEKAVVGEACVLSDPEPAPEINDPRHVVVWVQAVQRLLHPVSLGRIKADPTLKDWDLVRLPRLSIVPVTEAQWDRIQELAQQPGD
jgi:predicted RNA-binding protein with PUA-like domain